ncbi:hypothetical protein PR048_028675 [Dryococelus australis]|uniref:Uncharacterized protein n=1 Tax=Dryococelus australis TaxID=614101 RepID=A0ABQ9GDX1_9NEOP|nr:hypothetical protein PR048_028675 [Dryococelus australis]
MTRVRQNQCKFGKKFTLKHIDLGGTFYQATRSKQLRHTLNIDTSLGQFCIKKLGPCNMICGSTEFGFSLILSLIS